MSSARAIEAGKAIVRIGLDRDAVDRGLRDLEARFRAASATIGGIGKSLLASGAALGATALAPLTYAANLERTSVAFNVLIGDVTKANAILKDIQQFAAATPFGFTDLAEAGQTLLQYGVDSAGVVNTLRMLGDVSGGSAEKLSRLALAYGQTQAKGRLMGQEVLQMVESGFNPLKEISRTTGRSVIELSDAMSKGEISASMLTAAFVSATSAGGAFFNMSEKQSKTFLGRLSTLIDDAVMAMMPVGQEMLAVLGPAMDSISQMIETLAGTLATTDGLAASWLTAAATAAGLGVAMIAVSKAIAFCNLTMTVARAIATAMGIAWTILKVTTLSAVAVWIATQLAIHAVVGSIALATISMRAYGVQAVIVGAVTKAYAVVLLASRTAWMLMTNAVRLTQLAVGGYVVMASAVSLAQGIMTGRIIASILAVKGLTVGSSILSAAFGMQTVASFGLATVQGIVALATTALNAVLGTSVVVAGTSAGAAGFLATAWAGASGVIASAYAIITSPLIPLYLAIVAIVAIAGVIAARFAVLTVSSGLLGDAWDYIVSSAMGVIAVVKEVAAGLKEALAAGQYAIAAQILWAGVKQLFWMGVKEVVNIVRGLPGTILDILKRLGKAFLTSLYNTFAAIPTLLMRALRGESLGDAMGAIFATGDWLDGLATDKIVDAKNELSSLRGEVEKFAAIKKADEESAQKKQLNAEMAKLGLNGVEAGSGASPATDENEAATKIAELNKEIRELTLGADAAADAELAAARKLAGASDETIASELASIQQLRDRKRALEAEKKASEDASQAILDRIDAKGTEAAELGVSPAAIQAGQNADIDKALAAKVITQDQANEAKKKAETDKNDRIASRKAEGKQLADELKTPLEKFNDEMKDIMARRADGSISSDTANRAMARTREQFAASNSPKSTESTSLNFAKYGSRDAMDTILRTRGSDGASTLSGPQVPAWVQPMTLAANRQVQATTEMPTRFAAALAQQTAKAIDTKRLEDIAARQLAATAASAQVLRQIATNTANKTEVTI